MSATNYRRDADAVHDRIAQRVKARCDEERKQKPAGSGKAADGRNGQMGQAGPIGPEHTTPARNGQTS